ncbi:MAG: UPF0175 family protein [Tannerellaceae bacterium]|jgi:hypothetical protein|nr:UPF0175 family protein [Tannerellaceae bacterium]
MAKKSIVISLPDTEALANFDLPLYVASRLYIDEVLPAGQAATVAGLSRQAFVEIMCLHGLVLSRSSRDEINGSIAIA